jgi:hypothetical protein
MKPVTRGWMSTRCDATARPVSTAVSLTWVIAAGATTTAGSGFCCCAKALPAAIVAARPSAPSRPAPDSMVQLSVGHGQGSVPEARAPF